MNKHKLPWNWRRNIEFVIEERKYKDDSYLVRLRFKKGKNPKGFGRDIGHIWVCHNDFGDDLGNCVESVRISQRMKNRGLGKALYMEACKYIGSISTLYNNASVDAKRVWMSLERNYQSKLTLTFNGAKLTIYPRKKRKTRKR